MKLAMWSGPRNLSTAMMYAFGARPDFAVVDEPYYAAYLAASGVDHPLRREIIAAQVTDSDQVSRQLTGSNPGGKPHFYQKMMTHHMLTDFDINWISKVTNVFLIRHPARVIASYVKKRERPTLDDLGFVRQVEIYDHAVALGQNPVVIDSAEIRANPETALRALCDAIGLNFDPAMLHWPEGGHVDDGVWAPHWYGAVHESTGFAGPEGPLPELAGVYGELVEQALPIYQRLRTGAIEVPYVR